MAGRFTGEAGDMRAPARLLIAGLGNPMMADDGFGHAVVERLKRDGVPDGVRVETLAGDVLGLADLWVGETDVWLVDAVSAGSTPGSPLILDHRRLFALPVKVLSTHHVSLSEGLRWLVHGRPEMAEVRFRLYGVEVGSLRPEVGLSPSVAAVVDRLVDSLRVAAST